MRMSTAILLTICALSSMAEVLSELTVIATSQQAKFGNGFAYPLLATNSRGVQTVIFNAYSTEGGMQIAAATNSHIRPLISTAKTNFDGFASASAAGGSTVFIGEYESSPSGLFVLSASGNMEALAKGFSGFENPNIDANGQIVFTAESSTGDVGIWFKTSVSASPTLAVKTGIKIPGTDVAMTCVSGAAVRGSSIVFFGSSCDGANLKSRAERMCRTRRASSHAIHDSEANLLAGIFLKRANTSSVETIASFKTIVPGGKKGETFRGFSNPVIGDEMVAFIAETSIGNMGVYAYTLSTDSLGVVADTTTSIPGGDGGTFADFPSPPAVAGTSVAFYGAGSGSSGGVFAKDASGLFPLVTLADTLNGESISYLGFKGPDSFDGKTAAFYAVTTTDVIGTATRQ